MTSLAKTGHTGFSFAAIVDLKRARSGAEKGKDMGEQTQRAPHLAVVMRRKHRDPAGVCALGKPV
jgi:hypothetical protein